MTAVEDWKREAGNAAEERSDEINDPFDDQRAYAEP